MYTRAAASDFDEWETEHKNPGWGSDKIIPLLRKVTSCELYYFSVNSHFFLQVETYQGPGDPRVHGTSGPIKISYNAGRITVGLDFLETGVGYDKDRDYIADINDFRNCNGYGVSLRLSY